MQTLEAIKLITAEKEAIKRIIALETQKNATAGGDAVVGIQFLQRRMRTVEAMEMAIRVLRDKAVGDDQSFDSLYKKET